MEMGSKMFNAKYLYFYKRVSSFLIDETMYYRLVLMIKHAMDCCRDPIHKKILGVYISRHKNIIIAESFLSSLIKLCDKHIVIVIREEYDILRHVSH